MKPLKKIGDIVAGQMGKVIAHVCALAGYDVKLNDISDDRIKTGLANINGNMQRQVTKALISESDRQTALGRIAPAAAFKDLTDCDLVIESASEKEEVKKKIFGELSQLMPKDAILACNTS